jgi:hypothetical protein
MKKKNLLWTAVFLLAVTWMFSSCAAVDRKKAADMEDILSEAGFVPKQPVTPEDLARLEKATPLKLVRATRNGQVIYVYPDPYNCKCVYAGTEKEYQEFRRIAQHKRIPGERLEAVQLQETGPSSGTRDFWW